MVLKDSKWDKRAKYKYMKKHGLLKKTESPSIVPKWTSKKKVEPDKNKISLEDSDDEWDSDVDEALINHFYPSLSAGDALTKEQKIKIKQQILKDLEGGEGEGEVEEAKGEGEVEEAKEELDGIYLGKQEQVVPTTFNLEEFISGIKQKPNKSKKLLKNKMSENFLQEYGLDSYSYGKDDYNDVSIAKQKQKQDHCKRIVNELTSRRIDEYRIGQDLDQQTDSIRVLTAEEKEEDKRRQQLVEQDRFYKEMKRKFGTQVRKPQRVIEVNNFNVNDTEKLRHLQEKIERHPSTNDQHTLEEDIDELLGVDKPLFTNDPEEALGKLSITEKGTSSLVQKKVSSPKDGLSSIDIDFVDSLLK